MVNYFMFRKKFTDKENQSVLQKLREELKSLNPAISFTDVRGKSIEPVHSIMKTNHYYYAMYSRTSITNQFFFYIACSFLIFMWVKSFI